MNVGDPGRPSKEVLADKYESEEAEKPDRESDGSQYQ
jgi:hypothetical protein